MKLLWPKATLPLAAAVLALSPWVLAQWGWAVLLIWLQLAAYMVHQYEEHGKGKFKEYANRLYGNGREVLSDEAIFRINTAGVWGVDSAAFAAAVWIGPGAGLAAVYLSAVNAVSHIGGAVKTKSYNPGLWTSVAIFVPLGIYTLATLSRHGLATAGQHAIGLAVSIAIHAAIVAHVMRNSAAGIAPPVSR